MNNGVPPGTLTQEGSVIFIQVIHMHKNGPFRKQSFSNHNLDRGHLAAIIHGSSYGTEKIMQRTLPFRKHGHLLKRSPETV